MTQEGKYETGNAVRDTILYDQTGKMLRLYQQREKNRIALEKAKEEVKEETEQKRKFATIDNKFGGSAADAFEEEFQKSTVGLVSVEEFRAKRRKVDELVQNSLKQAEEPKRKVIQKTCSAKLSFDDEEDGEEEIEITRTLGFLGKNPHVDTSFLPDEARAQALENKKAELTTQYLAEQDRIKREDILITFSYYDGSGHRREMTMAKGTTIEKFLLKAQIMLEPDFPDMRSRNPGTLLYVKEDLIIPSNVTFYDLIKSEARGPHGVLFDYDGSDNDDSGTKSKGGNERHAGKVVCQRWYERNKHRYVGHFRKCLTLVRRFFRILKSDIIQVGRFADFFKPVICPAYPKKHVFPASSWEHFNPNVKYIRTVTNIIDREKHRTHQ